MLLFFFFFCLVAVEGVEAVFHMAAPNSSINSLQLHRSVNVDGRRLILDRFLATLSISYEIALFCRNEECN